MLVGESLTVCLHPDGGGVQVEVGASGGASVPPEPNRQRGELRCARVGGLFGKADVAALGKADGHL